MSSLAISPSADSAKSLPRTPIHLHVVPAAQPLCATCNSRRFCLPCLGEDSDRDEACQLVARRVRVRKGEILVRGGDAFKSLFTIRSGSCKSVVTTPGGGAQIAGYHIAGDLVGAGGIFTHRYDSTVIALEDTEFCVLPLERIETLARSNPDIHRNLNTLLSREFGRERKVMLMLDMMRAEQRLAAFLLDLAERYAARGYSPSEFVLRMTREEMGSHLGLKLETVSRLFSRFDHDGLIRVHGREVKLLDRAALQQVVEATVH